MEVCTLILLRILILLIDPKPMNQLSRMIYNNNPLETVKNWENGLKTPNCDSTEDKCINHCCHHILNDYYPDNFDVSIMSSLLLLLITS